LPSVRAATSELKVVNLIAQGATNRDVATQLHLSLRQSVAEQHD
jgi:DNA-binding NarL/FixJ family response regulator